METQSGKAGEQSDCSSTCTTPPTRASRVHGPHTFASEGDGSFEEQFGKGFHSPDLRKQLRHHRDASSRAVENASVAPETDRFPVLIFSHGGGIPVLSTPRS